MPSKLEKQQKFFQIVKAYKDKKMSAADVGKNVEDAAKDMSDKEVDKYTKLTKEDKKAIVIFNLTTLSSAFEKA